LEVHPNPYGTEKGFVCHHLLTDSLRACPEPPEKGVGPSVWCLKLTDVGKGVQVLPKQFEEAMEEAFD